MTATTMRQRILQAIHEKRLTMKPRWRVFLSTSFSFSTVGALALLLVFLESFLIYSVYQNGSAFLLLSGWAGVLAFLGTLPWLPIALGLGAAVGLGILINQRTRTYRLPFAYTLGMLIAVMLGGSYVIASTTLHPAIAGFAATNDVPLLHPLYDSLPKAEAAQTVVGEVQDVQGESFTLQNRQGATVRIRMEEGGPDDVSKPSVKKGDVVVIIEQEEPKAPGRDGGAGTDDKEEGAAADEDEGTVASKRVHVLPAKYQQGVRDDIAEKVKEMHDADDREEEDAEAERDQDQQKSDSLKAKP